MAWPALLAALAVAACGGGGSGGATPPPPAPPPPEPPPPGGSAATAGATARFVDRTGALGLSYGLPNDFRGDKTEATVSGGLALDDIDNDGDLDLYVAHGRNAPGRLFVFADGRFHRAADNRGIQPSGMDRAGYFVDLNNDGWKDFVSVQARGVEAFFNDLTGRFVEATVDTGIRHSRSTFSMAAADFDVDGDLDLFFAHWAGRRRPDDALSEYLWRGDGQGFFEDASGIVAIRNVPDRRLPDVVPENSFTPTFSDIDLDGYPDLLLASDFESSQVLRNVAGVEFADATTAVISDKNGMGGAVGDYDRDGDFDWFVTSIHDIDPNLDAGTQAGNRLYRNDGHGVFQDATDEAGVRNGDWGWGACFADFDNDGHLDLFHTNGMLDSGDRFEDDASRLFMSNGDGTFTDRASSSGISHTGQGRGVVCADYNGDGKVDVFIANNGAAPTVYENVSANDHRYLAVELRGVGGNPAAIGARVALRAAGGRQLREVRLGTWYLSQGPQRLHFGLGTDAQADEIEVAWPGPGARTSRRADVAGDRRLIVRHP